MTTPISSAAYGKGYVETILRAFDIFVGTLIWRDYGITISAMTGLELRKPQPALWAKLLGTYFLNFFWPGHCEGAIASDTLRAHQALRILDDKAKP